MACLQKCLRPCLHQYCYPRGHPAGCQHPPFIDRHLCLITSTSTLSELRNCGNAQCLRLSLPRCPEFPSMTWVRQALTVRSTSSNLTIPHPVSSLIPLHKYRPDLEQRWGWFWGVISFISKLDREVISCVNGKLQCRWEGTSPTAWAGWRHTSRSSLNITLYQGKGTSQPVGASPESLKLSVACVGAPEQAFTWLAWLIIAMNLWDSVQTSRLSPHYES